MGSESEINMRYKYVIVDDNDMDRLVLGFYLKEFNFLENVATFSNATDGLKFFENNSVDIIFLDIEMPKISGIDLLKMIRDKVKCAVFITSHPEFSLTGFEVKASDYIIKPLSKERIVSCVGQLKEYLDLSQKATLYENSFKKDSIFLKSGINYVKIEPYEVHYLEGLKDYTKVTLLNNKTITIHGNIGSIINGEDFKEFVRIHKSYAIHVSNLQTIKTNKVVLSTGYSLPLGYRYKKELLEKLKNI